MQADDTTTTTKLLELTGSIYSFNLLSCRINNTRDDSSLFFDIYIYKKKITKFDWIDCDFLLF